MNITIPSVQNWLLNTIVSKKLDNINNLRDGYKQAITKLTAESIDLMDEEKASLLKYLIELINQAREKLQNRDLEQLDLRLKLLESFEIASRKLLSNEPVTPNANIQWNDNKEILCQVFMQLKKLNTKKNMPFIPNTVEEIALFIKNNFEIYKTTDIKTIERTLYAQSDKIANNTTYFIIKRNE